jgi:hypothetical protein
VPFFNPSAAMFWNNHRNWEVNAILAEVGLDRCLGHPERRGVYHYHQYSACLFQDTAGKHSPIIGVAFDGFPIYGPWGYAQPDGTGGVTLMRSSYRLRSGERPAPPQGPGGRYDGTYVQDFEYVPGLGDLDACNGRLGITPEYPQGIYHYHATVDEQGRGVFPYVIGCYRGRPENIP